MAVESFEARPRIDKLASEGMRLLNFNVEAQCTPSRAALLTGRYAIRTGNASVPLDTPLYGLTQWEVTTAEMLSEAGYSTGMFGKWHLGQTAGRFPTDQGFDEWYGIPNSSDEAYWPDSMMFDPDSNPFATPEYVMEGRKGEQPKSVKVYNTNERRLIDRELTDKAIDFMKRKANAGKPFFAFIPYTRPHHHWKMIVKEIDNGLDATREYGVPRIYNLLLDPKEEHWLNYGPENAWVRWPLAQVLADHALSLRFSAHTPRRDGLSRAEERGPRRSKADARRHGLRQRRRPRRHHRSAVARP